MGTSAFLNLRHVSKAWRRAISPVEEWAALSLHRDMNSVVVFLANTDSPAKLDVNVKYSIETLCRRAPGFGERVKADLDRCTRFAEYLTWGNATDRNRDAVDFDY